MASPDIAETVEGQEAPKKQTLSVGGNFGGLWVFRAIHHVPKRPPRWSSSLYCQLSCKSSYLDKKKKRTLVDILDEEETNMLIQLFFDQRWIC